MSVRRHLVNLGPVSCDYRVGRDLSRDLPGLLSSTVARPRRALLAHGTGLPAEELLEIRRALADAGFAVARCALPSPGARGSASLADAEALLAALAEAGLTGDDLVVGAGDASACGVAAFCARIWRGGAACALVPSTLDAMCTVATAMRPLDAAGAAGALSVAPRVDLAVCDLGLVLGDDGAGARLPGFADMLAAAMTDCRRAWDRFRELAPVLAAGEDEIAYADALCACQTSRAAVARAGNPSVRSALEFGATSARALAACVPGLAPADAAAEGMRFEARLGTDVCGFSVDDAFAIDDCLADLGFGEPVFELSPERFIAALRSDRAARSNRFLLALPHNPGTIRLASVDDATLARHARAYLASRAPEEVGASS